MPRIVKRKRVDSEQVQGEGSWFEYKPLTIGYRREMAAGPGLTQLEYNAKIVTDHVLDWNWSDEDGKPLPKPSTEDFVNSLNDDELLFIVAQIIGSEGELKN